MKNILPSTPISLIILSLIIGIIFIWHTNASASLFMEELSIFENTKETSFPGISKKKLDYLQNKLPDYEKDIQQIEQDLYNISRKDYICEEDILSKIKGEILSGLTLKDKIILLRSANLFDNFTTNSLLSFPNEADLNSPSDYDNKITSHDSYPDELRDILVNLQSSLQRGKCLYLISSEIHKSVKAQKPKKYSYPQIIKLAKEYKILKEDHFQILKGLHSKSQLSRISLHEYYKNLKQIRAQFPESIEVTKSDYVSSKSSPFSKYGIREKFLNSFSPIQIAILRNTIFKLRERFSSDQIEIIIHLNESQETISLDPMERFRFVIKQFRKEWDLLRQNHQFRGTEINYTDFILASFETGLVNSEEIETLLGLEEIWDPKEPWWDKALYWGGIAGKMGAAFIAPPYGYIAIMAIVVIEGIRAEQDKKGGSGEGQVHSLF